MGQWKRCEECYKQKGKLQRVLNVITLSICDIKCEKREGEIFEIRNNKPMKIGSHTSSLKAFLNILLIILVLLLLLDTNNSYHCCRKMSYGGHGTIFQNYQQCLCMYH